MTSLACVRCGHGWHYHHFYDETLERYVPALCDHHSGCNCSLFVGVPYAKRKEEEKDDHR